MKNAIELRDFQVHKPGTDDLLVAVDHIVFETGKKHMLMGPSGSGKSCFLKSVAQLIPSRGTLLFDEKEPTAYSPEEYKSQVMYLSQTPFFINGTAEENLRWPFSWKVFRRKTYDKQRTEELLTSLDWSPSRLSEDLKHFSGGEKQIVQLIRSLLLEPRFLLLDEPTSALDEKSVHKYEALIDRWLREEPRGIIWSTHSFEQAKKIGGEIYHLRNRTFEMNINRESSDFQNQFFLRTIFKANPKRLS